MENPNEPGLRQESQAMSRRVYRIETGALLDSLRSIRRAGTRLPALTVGGHRVAYAPSNERLYVSVAGVPFGSISASGAYRPPGRVSDDQVAVIRALVENTVEVVRAVAAATEGDVKCAICNRILFAPERARGISPRCWEEGLFSTYERRAIAAKQRRVRIDRRGRGVRKSKPRKRRH